MGEVIAFITAFCWAASSIFFTSASKKIGPIVANRLRLILAVLILSVIHLVVFGSLVPINATPDRWLWLSLSGVVGLALGDTFLFQSYVLVGNRIGTLVMALVPVIGSLEAWFFLNEKLSLIEIGGITLCLSGIIFVILERSNGVSSGIARTRQEYARGIIFGILSAICQATGLALAKRGLYGGFSALSGVVIRMLIAMAALWIITILSRQVRSTFQTTLKTPSALQSIAAGTLFGPVIGVWLSLLAIQASNVGIASTLMALTPVIMLPVAYWGYHEKVSLRAVGSTIVALIGVAVILII